MCRGTASTAPLAGFIQSEWDRPSRVRKQPCRRRCRSNAVRFIRPLPRCGPRRPVRREARQCDRSSNTKAIASRRLAKASSALLSLTIGAGTSGQYAMYQCPSLSMIAVNSLCMIVIIAAVEVSFHSLI